MSRPVPSPSMNGMMGSSGTTSWPFRREMAVPVDGGVTDVKFDISPFRSGHLPSVDNFRDDCGKLCGKSRSFTPSSRTNSNVLALCTTAGRLQAQRRRLTTHRSEGLYCNHLTPTTLRGASKMNPATTRHPHIENCHCRRPPCVRARSAARGTRLGDRCPFGPHARCAGRRSRRRRRADGSQRHTGGRPAARCRAAAADRGPGRHRRGQRRRRGRQRPRRARRQRPGRQQHQRRRACARAHAGAGAPRSRPPIAP